MILLGVALFALSLVTGLGILWVLGLVLFVLGLVANVAPGPWVGPGPSRRRYW